MEIPHNSVTNSIRQNKNWNGPKKSVPFKKWDPISLGKRVHEPVEPCACCISAKKYIHDLIFMILLNIGNGESRNLHLLGQQNLFFYFHISVWGSSSINFHACVRFAEQTPLSPSPPSLILTNAFLMLPFPYPSKYIVLSNVHLKHAAWWNLQSSRSKTCNNGSVSNIGKVPRPWGSAFFLLMSFAPSWLAKFEK